MNYTLWIDNQAAGPFDVCQITELFLNGTITGGTQIRLDNGEQTESWMTLGDTFPSIATLTTHRDTMQMLSELIRSTQIPPSLQPQRVTVSDFDMGFGSMVNFMVKWSFAAIPALIVISLIVFGIFAVLAAIGASIGGLSR